MDQTKKIVRKKLKDGENANKKKKEADQASSGDDGDVVTLTDSNFDELVYGSEDIWFVELYAPWCGHCKRLQPEWNEAATTQKDKPIKFGKVDATVEKKLAQRFKVKSYPTLRYWNHGKDKTDSNLVEYKGGRSAPDFIKLSDKLLAEVTGGEEAKTEL
jgi:protein disulfide-isomerase A6